MWWAIIIFAYRWRHKPPSMLIRSWIFKPIQWRRSPPHHVTFSLVLEEPRYSTNGVFEISEIQWFGKVKAIVEK